LSERKIRITRICRTNALKFSCTSRTTSVTRQAAQSTRRGRTQATAALRHVVR
jgi:hypothetical protein